MARPMLGGVELQQVQQLQVDADQVLVQHSVPALEGDLFQGLERRATQITLTGVLTGPQAGEGLKTLRDKFHAAEPIPFVADLTTATRVDQVLIEELTVREQAGTPEQFEIAVSLHEYKELSQPHQPDTATPLQDAQAAARVDEHARQDARAAMAAAEDQIEAGQGTLEVVVEPSGSATGLEQVQIQVQGQTDDGQAYAVVLDEQTNGMFRKTDMPAGRYTITLQIK